jgi:hypothetical protein
MCSIIIDRFEGDFAVVEKGKKCLNIPRSLICADVKEGDVLIKSGSNFYRVDTAATAARRAQVLAKLKIIENK